MVSLFTAECHHRTLLGGTCPPGVSLFTPECRHRQALSYGLCHFFGGNLSSNNDQRPHLWTLPFFSEEELVLRGVALSRRVPPPNTLPIGGTRPPGASPFTPERLHRLSALFGPGHAGAAPGDKHMVHRHSERRSREDLTRQAYSSVYTDREQSSAEDGRTATRAGSLHTGLAPSEDGAAAHRCTCGSLPTSIGVGGWPLDRGRNRERRTGRRGGASGERKDRRRAWGLCAPSVRTSSSAAVTCRRGGPLLSRMDTDRPAV